MRVEKLGDPAGPGSLLRSWFFPCYLWEPRQATQCLQAPASLSTSWWQWQKQLCMSASMSAHTGCSQLCFLSFYMCCHIITMPRRRCRVTHILQVEAGLSFLQPHCRDDSMHRVHRVRGQPFFLSAPSPLCSPACFYVLMVLTVCLQVNILMVQ